MTEPALLYATLAAAYVRGMEPAMATEFSDADVLASAHEQGLDLHYFKRVGPLPRVAAVLGMLKGLAPSEVLDIGPGRGAFLWPLLDAFPDLPVTAVDPQDHHVGRIQCVSSGGVPHLVGRTGDVMALPFPDRAFDVVTCLEVLEHLDQPDRAASELVRVGRRFVIASVPSKPDDNPEHIQLFTDRSLRDLFLDRGAQSVKTQYVPNHILCIARLS